MRCIIYLFYLKVAVMCTNCTFCRNQKLLEPLAFASTITQLAHFRVDQSLLLMGFLYAEYSKLLKATPADSSDMFFSALEFQETIQTVLDSIEKCWKKCDCNEPVFKSMGHYSSTPEHQTRCSTCLACSAVCSRFNQGTIDLCFLSISLPTCLP